MDKLIEIASQTDGVTPAKKKAPAKAKASFDSGSGRAQDAKEEEPESLDGAQDVPVAEEAS
jgi:hypothetical protein